MSEENKAKDTFDNVKETAKNFSEEAKETAKEFSDEAKEVLSDGKNIAIIAHITIIGWIIAIIMNSNNDKKTEFASFYIRQMLGIIILSFVLGLIPVINLFAWILPLILWIISLVGALSGKKKTVFLLGQPISRLV